MEVLEARGWLSGRVGREGRVAVYPRRYAVPFLEDLLVRGDVPAVVGNEPREGMVQPLRVVDPALALDAGQLRMGMDERIGGDAHCPGSIERARYLDVVLKVPRGDEPPACG